MQSCIYRGHVAHRRMTPEHGFRYSTAWIYLDLDEIAQLLSSQWLLSNRRFSPASFRRQDHLGNQSESLLESVRQVVHQQTGVEVCGPVRLLTQLRHFGFYFSPLNVFYCFDDQERLTAMVAEVSNTPWNERHCYVLWRGNRVENCADRYSHRKEFHVSPFMDMDSQYEWKIPAPREELSLSIGCRRQGARIFQADLHLRRVELNDTQLLRCIVRRPIAAAHIIGAIYYQAFRLWMKKCPFYPHPQTTPQQRMPAEPLRQPSPDGDLLTRP